MTMNGEEMTEVRFVNGPTVDLVDSMGDDSSIAKAARVSVANDDREIDRKADAGLISYLMKHRHGSPFEHVTMTFRIEAPIFVFREFHRHRAGWSYNEMSGRYTQLEPVFYVPDAHRPTINVGTSARPQMGMATREQIAATDEILRAYYQLAWDGYQAMLADGVAKEVARLVLPVGIMSRMYATCNARSLMHFLSLRTSHPDAAFPSYPQYEIEQVALQMEAAAGLVIPATLSAFLDNGRVAP